MTVSDELFDDHADRSKCDDPVSGDGEKVRHADNEQSRSQESDKVLQLGLAGNKPVDRKRSVSKDERRKRKGHGAGRFSLFVVTVRLLLLWRLV